MKIKDLKEHIKNQPDTADVMIQIGLNAKPINLICCDEYPPTGEILLVTLTYDEDLPDDHTRLD